MRRLVLRCFQSPGDVVMLTAAVRDLHRAHPGEFETDVRTSAPGLWEHNPHLIPLQERDPGVEVVDMHYPLVHQSNQRPFHFIHGFAQFLEDRLQTAVPVTDFRGDIYLCDAEREGPPALEVELPERYWIIIAGGKFDFTAKWWSPASYQAVVDHFAGSIQFVQCGEEDHWHPRLRGATDLVGRTSLRQFVALMHHAEGVVCPVTFAMHLAAAVEQRGGGFSRPCVVVAGGREPPHWEAYPTHQFLHTVGALECCRTGGCWRSRCQLVGDGDLKDRRNLCERPVQVAEDLSVPKCMDMVSPQAVIDRVETYLAGMAADRTPARGASRVGGRTARRDQGISEQASTPTAPKERVLIRFRHGLGDAAQLTTVLRHLREGRPEWEVDVAALVGKQSMFQGLCQRVLTLGSEPADEAAYARTFDLSWDECSACYPDSPSSKAERCLREVFGLAPVADSCRYELRIDEASLEAARRYYERDCRLAPDGRGRYPVVLVHYEGNTSAEHKNLPHSMVSSVCETVIRGGATPVILDWDRRSPLPDGDRILNPHVEMEIWRGTGTGDAARIGALIQLASLMIGVDSGPLHVAGATDTPTLAVWTRHHPLHYFGLADNVLHLVPRKHRSLLRGDAGAGGEFFAAHYQFQEYDDLATALCAAVETRLSPDQKSLVQARGLWVRADNVEQDLVVVKDIVERDSYEVDRIEMAAPVVVDVGAHIGCFAVRLHRRNPLARIFSVECCPENIGALRRNAGSFARIVQAAMTYERDVALKNAVFPHCVTTGGSIVAPRDHVERLVSTGRIPKSAADGGVRDYWGDLRPIETISLEELCERFGLESVDILKLDCEGSEFSILENCQMLDRVGLIVGEYHGRERFRELVRRRLPDWDLRILKDGELGTFWLRNPHFKGTDTPAAGARQSAVKKRGASIPPLLVAAMRNDGGVRFDILRLERGRVALLASHTTGGLRGFARRGGETWTIDSQGALLVLDKDDPGGLREVARSPWAHEAHDLVAIGRRLATVSPTRSLITLVDPDNGDWSVRRPWLLPPIPADADGPNEWDRFHVNSLAHDGEQYVMSLFTLEPKPRDHRWHECDLRHGAVVRWGAEGFEEPLASEQYAPHSVRFHDGAIWWCESFGARVCREDGWRSAPLDGFARGLRFHEDGLLVGLSRSRTGRNPTLERCGVSLLGGPDLRELAHVALPEPYFEIYDLIPWESAGASEEETA